MATSSRLSVLPLLLIALSVNAQNLTFSAKMASLGSEDDPAKKVSEEWRPEFDSTEHAVKDPESVASLVEETVRNSTTRRSLGYLSCGTGNPIDDCWRCDPNWHLHRKRLADCAIGFGHNSVGGRDGRFYIVTDPGDYDAVNPRPGTLRHAVIQDRPLWILFKRDMVITLRQELIMNSFKTIDGRGVNVHIAYGACITVQYVTNIIIHGLHIHDCKPTGNAMVRSSPSHYGWRTMADGDAISIFGSSHVWVDHNSLSNCADGLVDPVMASTAITISNNYFTHHNEVILLGHSDSYVRDKAMQVTIAFNHFGEGLIQRMPRCRHGYFHVVNNDYTHWEMYAIGGSANPTINSQGNRYLAPANPFAKELLLGYLSPVRDSWEQELAETRVRYAALKGDLLLNPSEFTRKDQVVVSSEQEQENDLDGSLRRHEISHGDHPLSLGTASVWNQYFQDAEIVEQIDRDLQRTHPNMRFFSGDTSVGLENQEAMRNILLLFAKLNPAIRYVQGMNEVLAPLYYVLRTDPDEQNSSNAEADSFACFVRLLSDSVDHFCQQLDNSSVGILSTLSRLGDLLKANDVELWRHLEISTKVKAQFYAFRWITLLLTQEFHLRSIMRIWDSLISNPFGVQEMLLRVCCAMLLCVKGDLLRGDFTANLKLLQHYPQIDVEYILQVAQELTPHSCNASL